MSDKLPRAFKIRVIAVFKKNSNWCMIPRGGTPNGALCVLPRGLVLSCQHEQRAPLGPHPPQSSLGWVSPGVGQSWHPTRTDLRGRQAEQMRAGTPQPPCRLGPRSRCPNWAHSEARGCAWLVRSGRISEVPVPLGLLPHQAGAQGVSQTPPSSSSLQQVPPRHVKWL